MRVRLNAPEKCWQSGAENCCWSSRKKARASGPRGVWWKSAYQLERFQKLFYRAVRSPRHSFYLSPQRPESSVEDVISKHFPPTVPWIVPRTLWEVVTLVSIAEGRASRSSPWEPKLPFSSLASHPPTPGFSRREQGALEAPDLITLCSSGCRPTAEVSFKRPRWTADCATCLRVFLQWKHEVNRWRPTRWVKPVCLCYGNAWDLLYPPTVPLFQWRTHGCLIGTWHRENGSQGFPVSTSAVPCTFFLSLDSRAATSHSVQARSVPVGAVTWIHRMQVHMTIGTWVCIHGNAPRSSAALLGAFGGCMCGATYMHVTESPELQLLRLYLHMCFAVVSDPPWRGWHPFDAHCLRKGAQFSSCLIYT